jgi:hypothetical protein
LTGWRTKKYGVNEGPLLDKSTRRQETGKLAGVDRQPVGVEPNRKTDKPGRQPSKHTCEKRVEVQLGKNSSFVKSSLGS